ncbi:MAG: HAMP domain-containing sensor histidine kinase [Synechococcus sp.]|nr:HAMP domain-containing sensor histidine kinase [Synechococcus sp.]
MVPGQRQQQICQWLSSKQLLDWLENSSQGFLVLDRWNRLQHLNGRARRLLGIGKDARVINRYLLEVVRCHQLEAAVREARLSGGRQRVLWTNSTVSPSPLHPEPIRSEPLEAVASAGEKGWVAVFVQSRKSLQAQQEQQERWVSDVAHELRTPLTALSLVTESLAINPSDKQAVQVERLQRELTRLQQLVSDLLELSRLETAAVQPNTAAMDLLEIHDLVERAWQSLAPLAEQRGVELRINAGEPHPVRGNSSRLLRALLNLLDNALRHSPDNSTIEVRLLRDGRWERIEVRDQGDGFSPEDLQYMFDRFYRGDPSRSRTQRVGSGLGLAIVQQIAHAHGGHIRARNHQEGGAEMQLSLPCTKP